MSWNELSFIENPKGLNRCALCGNNCQETESVLDGFNNRGILIRINSLCDKSLEYEKDDIRTDFLPEKDAIIQWNEMNPIHEVEIADNLDHTKLANDLKEMENWRQNIQRPDQTRLED